MTTNVAEGPGGSAYKHAAAAASIAYRFYLWLPRDFEGVGADPGFPYDGGASAGIGFYRVCKWTGVLNPAVKAGKAVLGLCGAAAGATSRAQPPPGRAP